MERDMDLIRAILFKIEEQPTYGSSTNLEVEGYEKNEIDYHVLLLHEAMLISATKEITGLADIFPRFALIRLTWAGHEFLDAARDESRWKSVVDTVRSRTGALSFEIVKQALTIYMKDVIS